VRIVLCCATRRGLRVLERLAPEVPRGSLAVVSFRETAVEPPYLDSIRETALKAGALFAEGTKLDSGEAGALLAAEPPDLLMAVNWRYLIPPAVYERCPLGAWVFHDSLLPRYRGFSPTVWAMANGERETGVTLFRMAERVDEGEIAGQAAVSIGPGDTIGPVFDRVTEAYLDLLDRNLPALLSGTVKTAPQDHSQASYFPRRTPEHNRILWDGPACRIFDLVRAVTRPYPGAWTLSGGRKLTVWAARIEGVPGIPAAPGTVTASGPEGFTVATGDGSLLVTDFEMEGGNTAPLRPGERLG